MSSLQAAALGDFLSQLGLRLVILVVTYAVCALALTWIGVLRANREKIDQEIAHISNVQIAHLATMAVHAAEQAPETIAKSGMAQRSWAIDWLATLTGLPKDLCALGVDAAFHGLLMAGQIDGAQQGSARTPETGQESASGGGGGASPVVAGAADVPSPPAPVAMVSPVQAASAPPVAEETAPTPQVVLPPSANISTNAGVLVSVGDSLSRDSGAH